MIHKFLVVLLFFLFFIVPDAWSQPPQRIISLAPHITELLYSVGAGDRIVGAVYYSDYPPAAKQIPRVGSYERFDLEMVLSLDADLVVAWPSGNGPNQLAQLKKMGLSLFFVEPERLIDIPNDMRRLGEKVGTMEIATVQAAAFEKIYQQLQQRYAKQAIVRVFYQIWNQPLMTVNGQHLIADVMRLCGGENIFHDLPVLAPAITVEAVLQANPQAIIASGMAEEHPEWLDDWRRWSQLSATADDNLFVIHPDLIQRHTPRILQGAAQMCAHLEKVRRKWRPE